MQSSAGDQQAKRLAEMGAFLRTRRAAAVTEDESETTRRRRRVTGLRREEVAARASISVAWYIQMEQGRDAHPTAQVLDALSRALCLDDDNHRYLRRLGGHPIDDAKNVPDSSTPSIEQLLHALLPSPACVFTPWFDYVAWNASYVALYGYDPGTPGCGNGLIMGSTGPTKHWVRNRDDVMLAAIAQLRYQAANLDDNPRFRQLVEQLTDSSEEFRSLWDAFGVSRSFYRQVPTIIIDHPIVGSVSVSPLQLIVALHPGLHVSVHLPSGPEDRVAIARLVGP